MTVTRGIMARFHHIALEAALRLQPLSRTLLATPVERHASQMRRDRIVALCYGAVCHALFAVAALSMMVGMWFGMSAAFGAVPTPWAWWVNALLLIQFPLGHSALLTGAGRKVLGRLAPARTGMTLGTTTFAIIASVQLLLLFAFWTPSGIVWWRAEGAALWVAGVLYAASWLLLFKASWDAGAEVQSGLLGWFSLYRGVKPQFPPMPTAGLFRFVRQPIYVAFALTTWTVPVWTPDQMAIAATFSAYCLAGPLLKERRFARLFGDEWRRYRDRTPYWIPLKGRPGR